MYKPTKVFLTKGIGIHDHKLASFELALRQAGVQAFNIVTVSSILPAHCKIISKPEGLAAIKGKEGSIMHVVQARISTDEDGRKIAASVGMAVPRNRDQYGYLSEVEDYGYDATSIGDEAEDLAAAMLASTLGINNFDLNQCWNERKQVYTLNKNLIVNARNISVATKGTAKKWTTIVAFAILLP